MRRHAEFRSNVIRDITSAERATNEVPHSSKTKNGRPCKAKIVTVVPQIDRRRERDIFKFSAQSPDVSCVLCMFSALDDGADAAAWREIAFSEIKHRTGAAMIREFVR